jgi:LuxR family transcriptional regulator, maltose regulon positive regulatory protein
MGDMTVSEVTSSNIELLKTKYSMPGFNKGLLIRRICNHKLEKALNQKLTLITAPAGYGKTSAVLQWLKYSSVPATWLSLDGEDNDPLVFWRFFCAALESISPGINMDVKYIFESRELSNANIHLSIIIDSLANTASDFIFVLDDFHKISNPAIIDSLTHFIAYMPSNIHLILISRSRTLLKLTKLGLKENLVRINTEDLRFSTEEITEYYKTKGYYLEREDIQKIENYTEGWAAALVAVALSLNNEKHSHHVINNFRKSSIQIEDYIAEDVFNTWTKEQQDFMVETSILDRMCEPLCEAITGYDSNKLLKDLYEQNSFIVALDDQALWFRYHHLFLEFLRKKLNKKDIATVKRLHFLAGKWFKKTGFFNEAIEHFLKGGNFEETIPLIKNHGGTLVRRREFSRVLSWIEKLPDKYVDTFPVLMIFKTNYFIEKNDFYSAARSIEELDKKIRKGTISSELIFIKYIMVKCNFFLRQGDIRKSLQTITKATAHNIKTIPKKYYFDYFDINLYDISLYRTKYHSLIKMFQNNLAKYQEFIKHYRRLISKKPGYAPLIEGELCYESGRLDEAVPKLLTAVDEALEAGCPGALVPGMITIAKIRRAQGDIQGALRVIEECEQKLTKFHKPHWTYLTGAFKIRLFIDINDDEMINKWLTENKLSIYQTNIEGREYELIILARLLIYKECYFDANIILTRLLSFAENQKRNHSMVEIINLLAIMAFKNLDEGKAIEYFEKALSIGLEQKYVRSFVDELTPMVSLLKMYTKSHKRSTDFDAYAIKLLELTKRAVRNSIFSIDTGKYINQLTPMEKRVLKLITNAYTNKEIASKFNITVRTVKAHVSSIYKKLKVRNRAECILKVGKIK